MASVNSRLEALETRAVRRRTQRRFKALKMPLNIVEFAMARRYLGEAIFPRQGTLLKLAAGQLDALTPYDHRVIAEWSAGFTRSLGSDNPSFVGSWGVQPDILDRIALMRERTGGGLEEFLAIIGRRGSKNFLGAILAADRLYRLCAIEDFTETFGIQRGKRLQIFVFAANRDQAIRNQLRDITNMVTHAPCFEGLVADASKGRLLLYTAAQRAARGDRLRPADALVEVLAAETTERAARGPAMPMAMFDEFAHVTGAGSTADSVDLYQAARPATRQFKGTGFVYQASSPWDRLGQLWISYNRGLALDPATGTALNPAQITRIRPITSITVSTAAKARLSTTPMMAIAVSPSPRPTTAQTKGTSTNETRYPTPPRNTAAAATVPATMLIIPTSTASQCAFSPIST